MATPKRSTKQPKKPTQRLIDKTKSGKSRTPAAPWPGYEGWKYRPGMNKGGSEFLTGGYVAGDMPFQPKFKPGVKLDPSQVKFVKTDRSTEARFVQNLIARSGLSPNVPKAKRKEIARKTQEYRTQNATDKQKILNQKKLAKFTTKSDGTPGARPGRRRIAATTRKPSERGKR